MFTIILSLSVVSFNVLMQNFHTMKLRKIFYQRDGVKQDKNRIDFKILSAKSNVLAFGNSKGGR